MYLTLRIGAWVTLLAYGALVASAAQAQPPADPGELTIRDVLPLDANARRQLATLTKTHPEARALLAAKQKEVAAWKDIPPSPRAILDYEGLLNTDPRRIATVRDLYDMDRCAAWLEIWQATGDSHAEARCRDYLTAWASTYRPTGNDVNEYKLLPVLVAYEALRPGFERKAQGRIDAWVREMITLHRTAIQDSARATGNRTAKRLRLVALGGLILGEKTWTDAALKGGRTLITGALYADGTSHDLHERDTLTYHTTTLRPLIDLALVARGHGTDLYHWESPSGGSIRKSVDYMRPYALGERTRAEWTNSRAEIDRARARAGIAHYQPGSTYDPRQALPLLAEAEAFDLTWGPVVARLSGTPKARFPVWRMVVNEALRSGPEADPIQ